jgi:Cys-rich repeat protein
MSRITSLALVVLISFAASSACIDPGCIRNSECGSGFACKAARCVAASDSGVSSPKAGSGGLGVDAGKLDAAMRDASGADAGKM